MKPYRKTIPIDVTVLPKGGLCINIEIKSMHMMNKPNPINLLVSFMDDARTRFVVGRDIISKHCYWK